MKARIVRQGDLTSECWMVQFWGLEKCRDCEFRDTEDCGGQEIRRTLKNEKGKGIPLGEERVEWIRNKSIR